MGEASSGDWPHTRRALPWLLAGFVAMLYLVPIDGVDIPVSLPVDSTLDRLVLPVIALVALMAFLAAGPGAPRLRLSLFDAALLAFVAAVGVGLLIELGPVSDRGELSLAVRRLSLLGSYIVLYYIAVSVIRARELRAFGTLIGGLGVVLALGVIYEYATGTNVFLDVANALGLPPESAPEPTDLDSIGRRDVKGPTKHGLATASLLAVALSFTVVESLRTRDRRRKVVLAVGAAVIVAGGLATLRKASAVLPLAVVVTIALTYPSALRRLIPGAATAILVVGFVVPGAFGVVAAQLEPDRFLSASTTETRTGDYSAALADATANPVLGRGFGTFDPLRYRLLDNQYLRLVIEAGLVGAAMYLAIFIAAALMARASGQDPGGGGSALLAGIVAVGTANALYDVLGFPQVPYVFFLLAAMAVVGATSGSPPRRVAHGGPGSQGPAS